MIPGPHRPCWPGGAAEFPLTPRSPRSGGAFWGSGSALDALWDFASSPAKLSKLGGLARRKLLLLRKPEGPLRCQPQYFVFIISQ